MAKPSITTRAAKGSALTWTEGDNNLTNLRDATITIQAGTGGTNVVSDLNGTVTLVAGTNVTLSGDNTAKTVTINSTASGGASTLNDLTDVTISGSPMTGQVLKWSSAQSQWTNQSDSGIDGLYADPNPSLGGNLTVMGYAIVSSNNGNIAITPNGTGSIVLDGLNWPQADGTSGQFLTTNGTGQLSWGTSSGLTDIVNDTSPQLGGNLDVNGRTITSTANASVILQPDGTGDVELVADTVKIGDAHATATITTNGTGNLVLRTNNASTSGDITINQGANANIALSPNGTGVVTVSTNLLLQNQGDLRFGDSDSSNWVAFQSPATVASNVTWTLPSADGSNGQVLSTNGSGTLSWATAGGGGGSSIILLGLPTSLTMPNAANSECLDTFTLLSSGGVSGVSVSSNSITLPSGTYCCEFPMMYTYNTADVGTNGVWHWRNMTGSANLAQISSTATISLSDTIAGTATKRLFYGTVAFTFTLSTSSQIKIRNGGTTAAEWYILSFPNTGSIGSASSYMTVKITKIA